LLRVERIQVVAVPASSDRLLAAHQVLIEQFAGLHAEDVNLVRGNVQQAVFEQLRLQHAALDLQGILEAQRARPRIHHVQQVLGALVVPGRIVAGGDNEPGGAEIVIHDSALDLDALAFLAPQRLAGVMVQQANPALALRALADNQAPVRGDE
jgi:hypothetical protein